VPPQRHHLIANLAHAQGELAIRIMQRGDLDRIAAWPGYPAPYEAFTPRFGTMSTAERDVLFDQRENDPSRVTLVIDYASEAAIGYLALVEIDWAHRCVGNMGFRMAPAFCDKGIGTWALRTVSRKCCACGLKTLRLDVSAANPRAVRCYEKAGFAVVGEFYRDEPGLKGEDLGQPKYDLLRPHVQMKDEMPQVRFWWMEWRAK
jgi:RimJ/RimL family protein N-acetyltransferase